MENEVIVLTSGRTFRRVTPASIVGAFERFMKSTDSELYHVYGRYSERKACAFEYCRERYHEMNGSQFTIVSHNSNIFTVGFYFPHPETGELCFAYITPSYNKWCYVSEL